MRVLVLVLGSLVLFAAGFALGAASFALVGHGDAPQESVGTAGAPATGGDANESDGHLRRAPPQPDNRAPGPS